MRTSCFTGLVAGLFLVCAACGDSSDPMMMDGDGGGGRPDGGAPSSGLQCSSFALCTRAEVTTYATTVGAASGGAIASGLYRLAWVEASDERRAGMVEDLTALEIRDSGFVWTGGPEGDRGSLTTTGNEVTFHFEGRCALGRETDTDDRDVSYGYTATSTELRLYETIGGADGWEQAYVFLRMTDPEQACELVAEVPVTPGSSAQCNASTCFCSFAQDGTLDADACPF